jgi:ferredoxin
MLQSAQPYVTHGHPDRFELDEAEAFGREMAERAKRIAAGESNLIPEVPTPVTGDNEQGGLWAPHKVIRNLVFGEVIHDRPGGPIAHEMPTIDLTKCLYPRCTECMDTCPVNAIDHRMAAPAVKANDTKPIGTEGATLVVKEACQHCGGYCQRVCVNDAISYVGLKTLHKIDMNKCLYPKCTLCVDECMMDAIDFSQDPPVFHDRCEGCDLCWCICPVEGALVITNLEKSHFLQIPAKKLPVDIVEKYNIRDTSGREWSPGGIPSTGSRPLPTVGQGPAGPGGAPMMMNMQGDTPWDMPPKIESMEDFRLLIPEEEIGKNGYVLFNPNVPRIVLKKENWPYNVKG